MARKRRSFPIKTNDFNKRDVQEAVLLDLVHKHPRGPLGTLTKDDYRDWETDPDLRSGDHKYTCGYSEEFLYRIAMNMKEICDYSNRPTGEYDYRNVVRSLWPDCGDRGVTRRSRRLASRIGRAVSNVQRRGLPGIWHVNWGYNEMQKVQVAATNEVDAVNQAKIFFGAFIDQAESWRLGAHFIREGSSLELLNANQPMIDAVEAKKESLRERIAKIEEEIQELDTLKGMVEVYSISCLEA